MPADPAARLLVMAAVLLSLSLCCLCAAVALLGLAAGAAPPQPAGSSGPAAAPAPGLGEEQKEPENLPRGFQHPADGVECGAFIAVPDMRGSEKQAQAFLLAMPLYVGLLEQTLKGKKVSRLQYISQVFLYDRLQNAELCPAVVGLSYLLRAEQIILSLFPVASSETPDAILGPPRSEVGTLVTHAKQMAEAARGRGPGGQWGLPVLMAAIDRVEALLLALFSAMEEPWHATRRSWICDRDPWIWSSFHTFGRVTLVPLAPTPWDFDAHFGSTRKHLRAARADDMESGWRDVEDAMNEASGGSAEWWPIMGTLIALLRYGRLHGSLSEGKVDLVDDDVDLLVVLPSAREWFDFCVKLTMKLLERGWLGCGHMLQERYHNGTRRFAREGPDLRGRPILVCSRLGKSSDVLLNVYWGLPVRLMPGGPPCPRGLLTGRKAPGCNGAVELVSSRAEAAEAVVTEEVYCRREPGGDIQCWSLSIFFRHWPGGALPRELRRPLGRCGAFGGATPCPRGARELLQHWSGGEYWRPAEAGAGRWPCLALPDVACPDPSEHVQSAWRSDRQVGDPRNQRLAAEGLTREDLAILRSHQRSLLRGGLLAHNFSGCDWARCIRGAGKVAGEHP